VLPQKEFIDAASYVGFFTADPDPDGVMRRQPLVFRVGDVFIPALSVATAAVHFGANPGLLQDQVFDHGLQSVGFPREGGTVVQVPVDLNGRLLINYYGPSEPADPALPDDKRGVFPRVSLADVHDGNFDKALVKGKVVLIAVTAIGTFDQRVTPFSPMVPGVEVHAAAVQNMIDGRALKRPTLYVQLEMVLCLFVALMFGLVMSRLTPAVALLVFVAELVLWILVDLFVLFPRDLWMHDVPLAIQMLLSWAGITVWGYLTTGRDKARLKKEFSTVLAPTVVEQLLKDPKLAGLGGMERELTVMFSDIRGFTTMSEKLTPEGLTQFLNEYLTPMTEILIQREGTLDKYMGDAIMAFWGAPIEQQDHAARAALAALDMMEKLHELQKKWLAEGKPEIDIGIGLNSGLMRVGFMGSERMRNYTLLGDNVNLGSRLEGTNKNYGTHIIVSQKTYDASKHVVYGRWLDAVRVKGKREPVQIFELLGKLPKPGGHPPAGVQVWIAKFEEGMRHYHAQRWDTAEACFHDVIRLKGSADPPSDLYLERIAHFRTDPPPEPWDGVYEFKTK
jgi:adenylate cyclase